jgi:protease I
MANETFKGLKVAILIEDGFEQVEMVEPRKALISTRPTALLP